MKRFCVGDIHGAYKALKQVFDKSGFDPDEDQLISLGDVADGWPQVVECFDLLLTVKNLIYIRGNHDEWLLDWLRSGREPEIWISQGGRVTINSYTTTTLRNRDNSYSKKHKELLENSQYYYISEDNKLFVHGGFNWHNPVNLQSNDTLVWDRDLYFAAKQWAEWDKVNGKTLNIVKLYDEVFIGHTTTSFDDWELKPVHVSNVWNLDQGAGWEGKLTLIDIDSKDYVQSDLVTELYPGVRGRH